MLLVYARLCQLFLGTNNCLAIREQLAKLDVDYLGALKTA